MKKAIALILVLMTVIVSSLPIGAVQVTITEDFENQTVGSEYTNGDLLTNVEAGSPETSIVEENGNKYLSIILTDNAKLQFYPEENLGNQYVITGRFRFTYTLNVVGYYGFYIALDQSYGATNCAQVMVFPTYNITRIYDEKSDSISSDAKTNAFGINVWNCFKFERNGTEVSIKVWLDGQSEPAVATSTMTMTASDLGGPADIASPMIRVFANDNATGVIHLDDIVISTDAGNTNGTTNTGANTTAVQTGFDVKLIAAASFACAAVCLSVLSSRAKKSRRVY